MKKKEKIIIYQLLVRLAGNTKSQTKLWGTKAENGCGTFNDLTQHMLTEIAALGANHVWLTGVPEHASCTGYPHHGIPAGNPLVIKGQAGSPYAIRDYYDVSPDLAENVDKRMEEFGSLIERCHRAGLAPIIDFVPNHVAREYRSDRSERKSKDIGTSDRTSLAFHPDNNFYYIPGKNLELPPQVYRQPHLTAAENLQYVENPAKATGNDCFSNRPGFNDWYETVKLNYGIDFINGGIKHFHPLPDTWKKMLDILLYWSGKKISGFRCDMAEMVPVEFWKWCIAEVRKHYPDTVFIAEIYNPARYPDFVQAGFDYLYDKVGLYDAIRAVLKGDRAAASLQDEWKKLNSLDAHMLRFMENHDEQRIASSHFAGNARAGIPAMAVSATLHQGPVMVYFGQEMGEPAEGKGGYSGDDGRTSIFDYCAVPSFQKWYNHGKCNLELLSQDEKHLRLFYQDLLKLAKHPVISKGQFYDLMWANTHNDPDALYTYLRWDDSTIWLIAANFNKYHPVQPTIKIPEHFFELRGDNNSKSLRVINLLPDNLGKAIYTKAQLIQKGISVELPPLGAAIFSLQQE